MLFDSKFSPLPTSQFSNYHSDKCINFLLFDEANIDVVENASEGSHSHVIILSLRKLFYLLLQLSCHQHYGMLNLLTYLNFPLSTVMWLLATVVHDSLSFFNTWKPYAKIWLHEWKKFAASSILYEFMCQDLVAEVEPFCNYPSWSYSFMVELAHITHSCAKS